MAENDLERLGQLDPVISAALAERSEEALRSTTADVARWAVRRHPDLGTEPVVTGAVALLRSGPFGDSVPRAALGDLLRRLDERGWDLQDRIDEGEATDEEYRVAFRRARAAATLWTALGADPLEAAADALYEAHFVAEPHEVAGDLREITGAVTTEEKTVRFPQMRSELKWGLRVLADPEHQQRAWVGRQLDDGLIEDLDQTVHVLYDDGDYLTDPWPYLGTVLLDEDECRALRAVDEVFGPLLRAMTPDIDPAVVLAWPAWPTVLERARRALAVLTRLEAVDRRMSAGPDEPNGTGP